MEIKALEREIEHREDYLMRCDSNLKFLQSIPDREQNQDAIRLVEQEAFFLRDQLDKYHIIYTILREEQGSNDEMLPKA